MTTKLLDCLFRTSQDGAMPWAILEGHAMHDVSIPAALIAGLVSFLSPCVLPLVPPYLIYLTGATIEHVANDETTQASKRAVMASALMFVLGFSTVFVALGASASLIGGLIRAWSAELSILAGIVIIIMGLHFLGLTRIGLLMREGRMPMPKPVGLWGAYAMGLAFAFGWTPCIGPILAAILSIAAAEATVTKGAGLLAVYSAGLGIPFLLAAFMIEQFSSLFARMKRHLEQRRACHGRPDGDYRHRLPDRLRHQRQHLAAGDFPRTAKFRLRPRNKRAGRCEIPARTSLPPPRRGFFARTGFEEAAGRGLTSSKY